MKTLILGSKGQLGTALCELFGERNLPFDGVDLPEFDITEEHNVVDVIDRVGPEIIINTSAYTNVKAAEHECKKAISINGSSLKNLVEKCNRNNIYLCHISTDYVFDGQKDKPYIEEDSTAPINCYGLSKVFGEKIIQLYSDNYVILRTAALYGKSVLHSGNVVDKMIQHSRMNDDVSLVSDEYTSPTFAQDLANQIYLIIENKIQGIIHGTSEGECNWYEFGNYILETLGMKVNVKKVTSQEFSGLLKKPQYSVLENAILKSMSMNIMPHWKVALKKYLDTNY